LFVSAIEYTLSTKSIDVYITGCDGNPKCEGCHNPELWNFNIQDNTLETYEKILNYIKDFDIIENIMIFGGEPLDQNLKEISNFLFMLKASGKKIWLFTRYEIENIPANIIEHCDYIKTGRYIKELYCEKNEWFGINLATSNQKIHKL